MIQLSSLKINDKNPRFIKDEKFKKLVESLKSDPELLSKIPLKVDFGNNGLILGGNMRFRALKELGIKEIPESYVIDCSDLSEEKKKKLVIVDNASFGEWDFEVLTTEWDIEELDSWGVDIPDFEPLDQKSEKDPFDDAGIESKNKFGVIVMCENETAQEEVFSRLTDEGYNCKIVVT